MWFSHLTSFGSLSNGRRGGAFLVASVGWRAIPTRPAATQGQGGTVPPPPPPCSPPFLVQARSTPVASHTFTRLIFHPYRPIQFLECSHSLFWECPNYSHGFLMIFSPLSFPPFSLPPTSLSWESDCDENGSTVTGCRLCAGPPIQRSIHLNFGFSPT